MSLIRFVGTNQEFGEWLKIWLTIGLFISHLNSRKVRVPAGCTLSWDQDPKVDMQYFS